MAVTTTYLALDTATRLGWRRMSTKNAIMRLSGWMSMVFLALRTRRKLATATIEVTTASARSTVTTGRS
ncbi:hypothetical protein ACFX1R_001752 [Malus domestica]